MTSWADSLIIKFLESNRCDNDMVSRYQISEKIKFLLITKAYLSSNSFRIICDAYNNTAEIINERKFVIEFVFSDIRYKYVRKSEYQITKSITPLNAFIEKF